MNRLTYALLGAFGCLWGVYWGWRAVDKTLALFKPTPRKP